MILLKKIIAFITISLSVNTFSISQNKNKGEINFSDFDSYRISLPQSQVKIKPALPISGIKVFDVRFDTSCIGLMQKTDNPYFSIVQLKNGTISEIQNFYQNSVYFENQDTSSIELNCFIKKLILSDKIYLDNDIKNSLNKKKFDLVEKSGAILLIEFYTRKNQIYTPLYLFDSTITGEKDIHSGGKIYLSKILTGSLRKLETINWEKINAQANKLNHQEINEHYNQRFSIPVLQNEKVKGIYETFEDFKNSTPQKREFTVDKSKKDISLYIKNEKGDDILYTDLWGYCDGEDMYMFSASNYFKLYRFNNTYRIYGAKDYTRYRTLRLNFGLLDAAMPNSTYAKTKTATKYDLVLRLYQLDMDTGYLY